MVTGPAGPETKMTVQGKPSSNLAETETETKKSLRKQRHRCDDSTEIDQWLSNCGLRTPRIPRDYFCLPNILEEKIYRIEYF
jgi:hypothetical protein